MHEFSIAQSLVDIIREEMAKAGLKSLTCVHLKVGEFTHLVPDSLSFCFEIIVKDYEGLESSRLVIDAVPTIGRCNSCGHEFHVEGALFVCPKCRGGDVEVLSGREMSIESIEGE
jgi:hydrogenase nickel incorporation protein HypA/HybF